MRDKKNEIKLYLQSFLSQVTKHVFQVSFQVKNLSKRAFLPILSILTEYPLSKTLKKKKISNKLLKPFFIGQRIVEIWTLVFISPKAQLSLKTLLNQT